MDNKEVVIEVINYTKEFKGEVVLDNINMNFKKGNIYGIIGKNGTGKSVLFKGICGFTRPTKGYINVNGIKIGEKQDFPENVGMIIEKPGFLPDYSGFDNLKFLADINKKIGAKEIEEAMEFVELDPKSKKKVKNYSLGMKQRLGIAQAIMEDPEILILDEPMNALDVEGVELIREKLKELNKKGKTILITSHNQEDIDKLCNIVYKIQNKKLVRQEEEK